MPGSLSPPNRDTPTASVAAPDRVDANPVRRPRRALGMHLPCTSFIATEQKPRPRLNTTSRPTMASPAARPCSHQTAAAMASTQAPCSTEPNTQNPLRTGWRRIQAPIASCGISEPDSRIGTSRPASAPGAPTAPISQASTVLGLISRSPILVSTLARMILKKLPGTSRQASSLISRQVRASSSLATSAYSRSSGSRRLIVSLPSFSTPCLRSPGHHVFSKG